MSGKTANLIRKAINMAVQNHKVQKPEEPLSKEMIRGSYLDLKDKFRRIPRNEKYELKQSLRHMIAGGY